MRVCVHTKGFILAFPFFSLLLGRQKTHKKFQLHYTEQGEPNVTMRNTNDKDEGSMNLYDSFCNGSDIESVSFVHKNKIAMNDEAPVLDVSMGVNRHRIVRTPGYRVMFRFLIFGLLVALAILVGIVTFHEPPVYIDGVCLTNEKDVSKMPSGNNKNGQMWL
jgi:hypothetical protein